MCDGSITNGNNEQKETDCYNNFDEDIETCCQNYNDAYYEWFCLKALDENYSFFTCANGYIIPSDYLCDG